MLHLDLIRCFSPGGRARVLAKASLPFPTQLLPSSSVPPLLPSQGSSQGRIWGPTRPRYSPAAAGKCTAHAVVICEWANEQHAGVLYTKEREGPCLKNKSLSLGEKKQELGSQESLAGELAWLHVRTRKAPLRSQGMPRAGDKPLVGRETS